MIRLLLLCFLFMTTNSFASSDAAPRPVEDGEIPTRHFHIIVPGDFDQGKANFWDDAEKKLVPLFQVSGERNTMVRGEGVLTFNVMKYVSLESRTDTVIEIPRNPDHIRVSVVGKTPAEDHGTRHPSPNISINLDQGSFGVELVEEGGRYILKELSSETSLTDLREKIIPFNFSTDAHIMMHRSKFMPITAPEGTEILEKEDLRVTVVNPGSVSNERGKEFGLRVFGRPSDGSLRDKRGYLDLIIPSGLISGQPVLNLSRAFKYVSKVVLLDLEDGGFISGRVLSRKEGFFDGNRLSISIIPSRFKLCIEATDVAAEPVPTGTFGQSLPSIVYGSEPE